jgi:DNA-directed RNA polymerase specialized sigma24 family protein
MVIKYMEEKKDRNRSNEYQHLFCEIRKSDEFLSKFTNDQGLFQQNTDQIKTLQDQLSKEYYRLMFENCNDRQMRILSLLSDGYTQMETAKILGLNQSSINKTVKGNTYYGGKKVIKYGGITKRLRRLAKSDTKIQNIIQQIYDLMDT